MRFFALIALVCCLIPSGPARAAGEGMTAVVPYFRSVEDKSVLDEAADRLRAVLSLIRPGKVLDRASTEAGLCPLCGAALRDEAEAGKIFRLSEESIGKYLDKSFDEAEGKLIEAEKTLLAYTGLSDERRWRELEEIWLARARLYMENGREQDAYSGYLKIWYCNPEILSDEKRFSPKEREILKEIVAFRANDKRASLTVECPASAAGCEVFIDGILKGKAPVNAMLTEGTHSVFTDHAGARSIPRKVEVSSSPHRVIIDPDFDACMLKYGATGIGAPLPLAPDLVSRLAGSLGTDEMVVLRVEVENADIFVSAEAFNSTGGSLGRRAKERLAEGRLPPGAAEAMARSLSGLAPERQAPAAAPLPAGLARDEAPAVDISEQPRESTFYTKWWFWTAVAGAAAAVAGGTYFFLDARPDSRELTVVVYKR